MRELGVAVASLTSKTPFREKAEVHQVSFLAFACVIHFSVDCRGPPLGWALVAVVLWYASSPAFALINSRTRSEPRKILCNRHALDHGWPASKRSAESPGCRRGTNMSPRAGL